LSRKLLKDWDRQEKESLLEKISDKVHRKPPLRERLSNSIYRLSVIYNKMEQTGHKMEMKDRELFSKCTDSLSEKSEERAAMYANECAQVRKMAKIILRSQLAIEQVRMRMETVREFGDLAIEMGPIAGVVHSLKHQLAGIMPEVSYELGVIGDTMNGLVIEAGETTGTTWDIEASGQESQKILQDANAVAEQRMKDQFPELPVPTAAVHEKTPDKI